MNIIMSILLEIAILLFLIGTIFHVLYTVFFFFVHLIFPERRLDKKLYEHETEERSRMQVLIDGAETPRKEKITTSKSTKNN